MLSRPILTKNVWYKHFFLPLWGLFIARLSILISKSNAKCWVNVDTVDIGGEYHWRIVWEAHWCCWNESLRKIRLRPHQRLVRVVLTGDSCFDGDLGVFSVPVWRSNFQNSVVTFGIPPSVDHQGFQGEWVTGLSCRHRLWKRTTTTLTASVPSSFIHRAVAIERYGRRKLYLC